MMTSFHASTHYLKIFFKQFLLARTYLQAMAKDDNLFGVNARRRICTIVPKSTLFEKVRYLWELSKMTSKEGR
jgi:hypothetical protein